MEHVVWLLCFAGGVLAGVAMLRPILWVMGRVGDITGEDSITTAVVLIVLGFAYFGSFFMHSPWPLALDGFLRGVPLVPLFVLNFLSLFSHAGRLLGFD